jgi:hypothetical protein
MIVRDTREENMKRAMLAVLILTTTSSFNTIAFAQKETADIGGLEFEVHCAIWPGMYAKGNGPYVSSLKFAPPNLTLIARNNASAFPADNIIGVIDGRAQVKSHGSRDMPIWGDRYAISGAEHFAG